MKNQITFLTASVALVVIGIFIFIYADKPKMPFVGENGRISGNYSIEGIMALGKPYICKFGKMDGISQVFGSIYTNENKIYADFNMQTTVSGDQRLNSFLIIKDKTAYIWTSLQPTGYKTRAARSAFRNASPLEQAQIIGLRDEMRYECEPWADVDNRVFETPDWITFKEVN